MARLESYGITDEIRSALADLSADGAEPARIITGDRSGYRVVTDKAELPAQIAGRFRFNSQDAVDLPVTGDWVAVTTDSDQMWTLFSSSNRWIVISIHGGWSGIW
jgi:ribosome biogenesis GTPase